MLFVIYLWHFNVDINSVKDGSGDPFLIFGNDSRRTPTGFCESQAFHMSRDTQNQHLFSLASEVYEMDFRVFLSKASNTVPCHGFDLSLLKFLDSCCDQANKSIDYPCVL